MKTCTFGRRNFLNLILAASALGGVTLCSAQTPSPTSVARANPAKAVASAAGHAAPSSGEKRTEEELPNKGVNAGIKVHGHWVIDVKNPDGSIAQHREFENSLQDFTTLPNLLSGQTVAGGWVVTPFYTNTSDTICGAVKVNQGACYILQSGVMYGSGFSSPNCTPSGGVSCNLTLSYGTVPTSGAFALILSGSVTAIGSGSITGVSTTFYICSSPNSSTGAVDTNTFSPTQCAANASGANQASDVTFTSTTLANPIPNIQPQQTIAVLVYLSFQ